MKRRNFLKSMSLLGSTCMLPSLLQKQGFISPAQASLSKRELIHARALVLNEIGYVKPTVMPQIISIFLYGGPSELAGNLTNINEIDDNSQNPYNSNMRRDANNSVVTPNGFWGGAGGEVMERMVGKGRLSVYRTIHRVKDDSKAHRPSIFSNLTGAIGVDDSRPGIATNLAAILAANNAIAEDALFPFVTFEGETVVFNQGSLSVPLGLKPISLDKDLRNPYARSENSFLGESNSIIDSLAQNASQSSASQFSKVIEAFKKRGEIEVFVNQLKDKLDNLTLPNDPDRATDDPAELSYPDNNFGNRLKAAVNLAINNPDSVFISLGSGGLGGWDDHDSALEKYSRRMRDLMLALEVAAKHLEVEGKGNVVINVFGDFGRNVNLNNSMGWDHGNNQNLFTVGASQSAGSNIPGRELGKIVGKTERIGKAKVNRQFTTPTADSYQCEPFSIASSIYGYFGIQNPEKLTGEPPIDETAPNEWINPDA